MRLIDADHLRSMLQEYIKREQAYIDIGNNTSIAIGHSNGLWEAIAQIDEEPTVEPQRWIPVSERLPENNDDVLTTYIVNGNKNKRYTETATYYDGDDGYWSSPWDEYRVAGTSIEVIAWMPLPEPWEGQDET